MENNNTPMVDSEVTYQPIQTKYTPAGLPKPLPPPEEIHVRRGDVGWDCYSPTHGDQNGTYPQDLTKSEAQLVALGMEWALDQEYKRGQAHNVEIQTHYLKEKEFLTREAALAREACKVAEERLAEFQKTLMAKTIKNENMRNALIKAEGILADIEDGEYKIDFENVSSVIENIQEVLTSEGVEVCQ